MTSLTSWQGDKRLFFCPLAMLDLFNLGLESLLYHGQFFSLIAFKGSDSLNTCGINKLPHLNLPDRCVHGKLWQRVPCVNNRLLL